MRRLFTYILSLGGLVANFPFFIGEEKDMGQVHTLASKYVFTNDGFVEFTKLSNSIELKNKSIEALEKKERQFYNWLNCDNFPEFIKRLRDLFEKAGEDKEVFNKFKKANLDLLLGNDRGISKEFDGATVILELQNLDKGINLKELLGPDFVGDDGMIYFTWDSWSAKAAMNEVERKVLNRNRHQFKVGTDSMRALRREIKNLLEEETLKDIFIITEKHPTKQSIKETISTKNSAFGLTSKTIQETFKDKEAWKELRPILIQKKEQAFNFIMDLCSGGTDIFRQAVINAWNNKIGNDNSDQTLLNFGFLSTGGSRTTLKGNIQELLGAAILGEYIQLQIGQGVNKKVAEVLGDIRTKENIEQPKTDVQLLEAIGIQVKAYDPEKEFYEDKELGTIQRLMKTDIHPNKIDSDLNAFLGTLGLGFTQNIGDYMVQACFNKTNDWSEDNFEEAMENALVQLMNLDTDAGLSDAISFYLVDVTQLVPASHILASFETTKPEVTYRIPSKYEGDGHDDEYFNDKEMGTYLRSDNSRGPNFLDYYNGGHPLTPTDLTLKTYQDLYTKSISIDVKFNYHFMYDARYSII